MKLTSLTLAGLCIIIQFKQINQPYATSLLLDVSCRSTCFGHLHAHRQELTTALTVSGFTLERGGSSVVGRGLASYAGQTTTNIAATTTLQGKTRGC